MFKKSFIALFVLLFSAGCSVQRSFNINQEECVLSVQKIGDQKVNNKATTTLQEEVPMPNQVIEKNAGDKIKDIIRLDVPYTAQAPFANWKVHEESCEEAAVLMAHYYLQNKKEILPKAADMEIRDMKEWQVAALGGETDLYREDYVNFIEKYFAKENYKVRMLANAGIEDLKRELRKGNPVIVPTTAKALNNPWYHHEGYHMVIVIGYHEQNKQIITNDPGTKRGLGWAYNYDIMKKAMKEQGGVMFIVEK